MRIKSHFLSKILLAAMISAQPLLSAQAQMHLHFHHSDDSMKFREQVQKIVALVENSSDAILEEVVNFANKMADNNAATNVKGLTFNLKFLKNSQNSVDRYEIGTSPDGKSVIVTILVNESAKKNPFIMLESLIQIGKMYSLSNVGYSDFDGKGEWVPSKHPHHAPEYIYTSKDISVSLEESLGVPSLIHHHSEPIHGLHSNVVAEGAKVLSPVEMIELLTNAKAGSVFAQRRLAEMDASNFVLLKRALKTFKPLQRLSEEQKKIALIAYGKTKDVSLSPADSYEISLKKFIDVVDKYQKDQLDILNRQAKQVYKEQQRDYKAGAAARKLLSEGPALNEMIKANDREGVASAMEKMLPWSIMEPTEKVFWQDFVDAVRKPNYENAEVFFRGVDENEKFQALKDAAGNVIGGGMLSKRLTSGSGSHFLKLQGLPETFETFGTYGGRSRTRVSPLNQPHLLSSMMLNHAAMPVGSPFISLTYSLQVARGFAVGSVKDSADESEFKKNYQEALKGPISAGLATVVMDPRRVLANSISPFKSEVEVLASMFIFPDETAYLEKGISVAAKVADVHRFIENISSEAYYANARAAVFKKTGIQLPQTHEELATRGRGSFKKGVVALNRIFERAQFGEASSCKGIFN